MCSYYSAYISTAYVRSQVIDSIGYREYYLWLSTVKPPLRTGQNGTVKTV